MKKWAFPLLVALLAWGVFVFHALFLQPKLMVMAQELGQRPFYASNFLLDIARWISSSLFTGCGILLGLTLLLALPAVLPFLAEGVRSGLALVFQVWTFLLTAMVFGCLLATLVEFQFLAMDYDSRNRMYEKVMMEHAILEEAQDRHQRILEALGRLRHTRPVETPVSEMDAKEKRARSQDLLRALHQPASIEVKKRLLASLAPLREQIRANSGEEERFLKVVAEITGQDFGSVSDFFLWLDSQGPDEGWEPVPYYRLVPD